MSIAAQLPTIQVMVASSVYGFETDLDQICGVLQAYGYSVLNSRLGTIPPHPNRSNLENCLDAVRLCDVFLGIVRPFYGTGTSGQRSITHEEMCLAVQLNKPRWFLVHGHVIHGVIQERVKSDEQWEWQPAVGITTQDLDTSEISSFIRQAVEAGRFDSSVTNVEDVLRRLNLVIDGRATQAAVAAFGSKVLPWYPQCTLRLAR